MREKEISYVVVEVLEAELYRSGGLLSDGSSPSTYVTLSLLFPSSGRFVRTNCRTRTVERTLYPVFSSQGECVFEVPVRESEDVLWFQVMIASRFSSIELGSCMFPADSVPDNLPQQLSFQLFSPENTDIDADTLPEPKGILTMFIKRERRTLQLLELSDLSDPERIKSLRAKAHELERRFLGIGELADLLFEEGYSEDMEQNWNQAKLILSEQLALQKSEAEPERLDDYDIYVAALQHVEEEGGLWDGV
ncbi:hypothetical protein FVE85_0782 [Porphyridium purpureum]|uniref:C2 domain-containing protein n=1 Tax=Porphyridium purpureum TaxID=35688 RepID=A0A5J4Z2B5_PORPP|nr:hypothetical protein FVE85_0782 [Porphyridium purpureum]|eukprot:POR1097..scf208_2